MFKRKSCHASKDPGPKKSTVDIWRRGLWSDSGEQDPNDDEMTEDCRFHRHDRVGTRERSEAEE